MRKKWKDILTALSFIGVVVILISPIAWLMHHNSQYTEYEYDLYDMGDGVYVVYYTTHSRAPAYNYEVVTVCCNGSVRTFKGHVNISFTKENPHMTARISNMVNSDEVYVYVPHGTVVYQPSVDVGR